MKSFISFTFIGTKEVIFVVLNILLLNNVFGTEEYTFTQLTAANGLSSNNTTYVYEDQKGFIWVGTTNGLNRYEGKDIYAFQNDPFDSTSIISNHIVCIFEDSKSNLWIGTENGLSRYNRKTNQFNHYIFSTSIADNKTINSIQAIYEDSQGYLWLSTRFGLIKYDFSANKYSIYFTTNAINGVVEDEQNNFWVINHGLGLILFNREKESWVQYPASPENDNRKNNQKIISLFKDSQGFLWLGNEWNEVLKFDPMQKRYISVLKNTDLPGNHDLKAHAFSEDENHNIWMCTPSGLIIHNIPSQQNRVVTHNKLKSNSLSSNNCTHIFKDRHGRKWVSTMNGGINIFDPSMIKFHDKLPSINQSEILLNKSFKSAHVDQQGNLWIGTDYGLNKIDQNGNIIKTFTHEPNNPHSIGQGGVTGIINDLEGRLWIGLWGGGMYELDQKTYRFKQIPFSEGLYNHPDYLSSNLVLGFSLDNQGYIWVKNVAERVNRFDPRTAKFEHFKFDFNSRFHHSIVNDTLRNTMWVSSYSGFYRININTGDFTQFLNDPSNRNSLINNVVYGLCLDNNGMLWLSTAGGLNRFNPETNSFELFTTDHGLASNVLFAIQKDNNGHLWISSDKGITQFIPDSGKFFNYGVSEGALPNTLYSYKAPDGTLFFGGTDGVNIFHPDEIINNTITPTVAITGFAVRGAKLNDKEIPFRFLPIDGNEKIVLSYHQSEFTIRFSSLNYTLPEKNQFAYLLEGFDKDWKYIGTRNEATFTNLDPGTYIFRVKASNNDGIWNETGDHVKIIITPPFWKTWWFKLLVVAFTLLVILIWHLLRTKHLIYQRRKLEGLVKQRTSELTRQTLLLQEKQQKLEEKNIQVQEFAQQLHEADQKRIRFFINITHEFRTPLTLIINPLERILSSLTENKLLSGQMEMVYNNSKRLLNLINQILDIRKLESGAMKLRVAEGDIVAFAQKIHNAFSHVAEDVNIEYRFISTQKSILCWFDHEKLEKILFNLLSNAFKFTDKQGRITMQISSILDIGDNLINPVHLEMMVSNGFTGQNYLELSVRDTGIGIPADKLDLIFNRFYQVENAKIGNEGSGIGLSLTKELAELHHGLIIVESQENKGSCFTIYLPVARHQFQDGELNTQDAVYQVFDNTASFIDAACKGEILNNVNPQDNGLSDSSENLMILLVDDNNDLRQFISQNIPPGYSMAQATDGKDGHQKALSLMPDIVISDVAMPVMNGLELCRKLKENTDTCHIPVILLTAKADESDMIEGLNAGADDFISKPFNLQILLLRVKKLIENREMLREKLSRKLYIAPSDISVDSIDEEFLRKAMKIVEENIDNEDLSVDFLVKEMHLGRTMFYNKIKTLTGLTVNHFIQTMRLKRAAQFLKTRKYTISEISYMVGFKNPKYFSSCFRDYFGNTPSDYIAECNKSNEQPSFPAE